MSNDNVIVGIDPGTTIMGYGVVRIVSGKPNLVKMDVLTFGKTDDHFSKLNKIFNFTCTLIKESGAHEVAIEAPSVSYTHLDVYKRQELYNRYEAVSAKAETVKKK